MNQKRLLELKPLLATRKIIQIAKNDKAVPNPNPYGEKLMRKYRTYVRSAVLNGILKVSLYKGDNLRCGGKEPIYDIYISKDEDTFLTYDANIEKFRGCKLDSLENLGYHSVNKNVYISKKDNAIIKKYLSSEYDGLRAVLKFQEQVRYRELLKRHKKETDPWDEDLKRTPALPKTWDKWVNKVGIEDNYIFYTYKRNGAKVGYCTFCEKEVPISKPYHNVSGHCKCCRKPIIFKSVGKAGTVNTPTRRMQILLRCTGGFMIREFTAHRVYKKGAYETPVVYTSEVRRTIYENGFKSPRSYYQGMYKQKFFRFIKTAPCRPSYNFYNDTRVYTKNLCFLNKDVLRFTGFYEYILHAKYIDAENYFAVFNEVPKLEQLAKAKLFTLAKDCIENHYIFNEIYKISEHTELSKVLGISKSSLKRLRTCNGGISFLKWIKLETEIKKEIPNHIISWFCEQNIDCKDIDFILNRMTLTQVYNYMKRQMSECNMTSKVMLTTWKDYLSMAKKLRMNTFDEIIFKARKLKQRHDELVIRSKEQSVEIKAFEILEEYPKLRDVCLMLKEKYEYLGEEYSVIAPTSVEDIINEGRALTHCVAESDRYWDRMQRNEAYIMFLRKSENLSKSYYTLEIEPDGTVRQKRSEFDRHYDDIDDATTFLKKWQKIISARLDNDDLELAKSSKQLRLQGFEELRHKNLTIDVGDLKGQKLVDVLTADLIENVA